MPQSPVPAPVGVVIADDDERFLESLRELINRQPELTVLGAARDGVETVELVDALAPQAAVIDLHMPRLNGVAAVARLRRDHPTICLIALTGDPDPELHGAVEQAGADAVLLKDELLENLLERLASLRRDG